MLGIVLALALAAPVCVALAGRRLSWFRLSCAVVMSQFAFHGLLTIGVVDPVGLAGRAAEAVPAHLHGGMAHAALFAGVSGPGANADAWMWIAHALAAAITVGALGAGERAVRAVLELFGWPFLLRLLNCAPLPHGERPRIAAAWQTAVPRLAVLTETCRRGPPLQA